MQTQVEPLTNPLVQQEDGISEMRKYSKVLRSARELPVELQIMLAQQLLIELSEQEPENPQEIVDLLESLPPRTKPAPSDGEIQQWIDESRTERYS